MKIGEAVVQSSGCCYNSGVEGFVHSRPARRLCTSHVWTTVDHDTASATVVEMVKRERRATRLTLLPRIFSKFCLRVLSAGVDVVGSRDAPEHGGRPWPQITEGLCMGAIALNQGALLSATVGQTANGHAPTVTHGDFNSCFQVLTAHSLN